jgi:predicted nicotinamide N-methyase
MGMLFSIPLLLLCRSGVITGCRPCTLAYVQAKKLSRETLVSSTSNSSRFSSSLSLVNEHRDDGTSTVHIVDGLSCREVPIDLPVVGTVTVLEATAQAQEDLVEMALAMDESEIRGQQKLSEGDPYGAVLWPAAWAVAKYLLTTNVSALNTEDSPLAGVSIVELGTGTGLVSIAAALGGAKVLATDYEPLALALTQYSARTFHGRHLHIETRLLDMCDHNTPLPKSDIVVAADIMYEPKTGVAMAYRAVEALKQGSRVIVGDSPGRPGRPAFLDTLRSLGVSEQASFVETIGRTCSGSRHDLICGKGSTSVSQTPQDLSVALMDLSPSMLK